MHVDQDTITISQPTKYDETIQLELADNSFYINKIKDFWESIQTHFSQNENIASMFTQSDNAPLTKDLATLLNTFKPSAGEEGVTSTPFSSIKFLKTGQEISSIELLTSKAIGSIDKTELDFSNIRSELFEFTNFQENGANIFTLKSVIVVPDKKEILELPEAHIIVSNQTYNQTHINNSDHYALVLNKLGKNEKVSGNEMDIATVSDSAFIKYNYKSVDHFKAVLKSGWNSVKNIEVDSSDLSHVVLKNFVHTDVSLLGENDLTLKIIDAKRGFIETGNGNDNILIRAETNGSNWSNTFEISSGAGDDTIRLKGDGHTASFIDTGIGNDTVKIRGIYEFSETALGDGNDAFKGGKSIDIVFGDQGNDRIKGHAGNDILFGGSATLANIETVQTTIDLTFVKSIAGFKNTLGFYEVDSNGVISNVHIAFDNLKNYSEGDVESFTIEGISPDIHTFIIANGYNKNGQYKDLDLSSENLSFIYHDGESDERLATIHDPSDSISLVYNDGGTNLSLDGYIYHETETLNHDQLDHVLETVQDDGSLQIAFEDLPNLGDKDFTDAVVLYDQNTSLTFLYETIGTDNDALHGGKGHDRLIGGQGDDILKGGKGIDIAFFMGSQDDYLVTQTGRNKFTVEDTVSDRDGTDTLKGIEGIVFGIEDLYANILTHWSSQEISDEFGSEFLTIADLVREFDPLQNVLDSFISGAEQGSPQSVTITTDHGFTLGVTHIDDLTPSDMVI